MARAGRGMRWRYDIGVGAVRVPGKPRIKSPGFGMIRRRMFRSKRATKTSGSYSSSGLLAVFTGGLSLLFGGSSFGGTTFEHDYPKIRKGRRPRASFDARLQVPLSARLLHQLAHAKKKLEEVNKEIEEVNEELWISEQYGMVRDVTARRKRLVQLEKLKIKWSEQTQLLEAEARA